MLHINTEIREKFSPYKLLYPSKSSLNNKRKTFNRNFINLECIELHSYKKLINIAVQLSSES